MGAGGDFFCHERVLMETFLPRKGAGGGFFCHVGAGGRLFSPREGAGVETGADFGNIYNELMNPFQNRYFQLMARDVLEKEKRIHI